MISQISKSPTFSTPLVNLLDTHPKLVAAVFGMTAEAVMIYLADAVHDQLLAKRR